tara:strand:+ start:356 stop:754 length:399 start_codon:yes stop_codon:yes gene_type:complete
MYHFEPNEPHDEYGRPLVAKYQRNRFVNKEYLKYVSLKQCCFKHSSCDGYTEVHHLLRPWIGERGMSLKADDRNVVPLCMKHHRELHTKHGTENNLCNQYDKKDGWLLNLSKEMYENYENYGDSSMTDDLPF